MTCFMFYCKFYFTCDRSLSAASAGIVVKQCRHWPLAMSELLRFPVELGSVESAMYIATVNVGRVNNER